MIMPVTELRVKFDAISPYSLTWNEQGIASPEPISVAGFAYGGTGWGKGTA